MLIVSTMWKTPCDIFHNVKVQFELFTLWKLQCRLTAMQKDWFKVFHKTWSKITNIPQCAKKISYTLWIAESFQTKLPQKNSSKNFVEEMLVVSIVWEVLCDIFHNVENTI